MKMDGWNTSFLLGRPIFRCYFSFREGKSLQHHRSFTAGLSAGCRKLPLLCGFVVAEADGTTRVTSASNGKSDHHLAVIQLKDTEDIPKTAENVIVLE